MSDTPPGSDGLEIFDGPPPIPGEDAVPPVSPTAPPAPETAHPGVRAFAWLLDGVGTVALTVILVFIGLSTGSELAFQGVVGVPVASAVLATVLTAFFGVTPGKALVGIRVVHVRTGRPLGAWSLVRSLVIVAPIVVTVAVIALSSLLPLGPLDAFVGVFPMILVVPNLLWLAMFVVVVARPDHRGLEDLAARSVVVRR